MHIIITGTGRAGTTVLMILLTKLGIDTGFTEETLDQFIYDNCKAGLEKNILSENPPYVVKSPAIMDKIDEVVKNVKLEHIIVPIRNFESAANSRIRVHHDSLYNIALQTLDKWNLNIPILNYLYPKYFLLQRKLFYNYKKRKGVNGGLWDTKDNNSQQAILEKKFISFITEVSKYKIPVTFINFPKLITDKDYLFAKIKPIFPSIEEREFSKIFENTIDYNRN